MEATTRRDQPAVRQPTAAGVEIVTIQNQHDKKDYGFPCDQEPLRSFCNKTLCKTKKFGIGVTSMAWTLQGYAW